MRLSSPTGPAVRSPLLTAVVGSLGIAMSGVWVVLADVPPAPAAFFRCAYALPLLAFVAWRRRPTEPVALRPRLMGALAGLFFTADLIMWHTAMDLVGAGLATVLAAGQVVIVPLASWALLGERPHARVLAAIPVLASGVVIISGVLGTGAYGSDPLRGSLLGVGTGVAYAGFLLALRQANVGGTRPAGALRDATALGALGTAVVTLAQGQAASLIPSWPSAGWLLALAVGSQVIAWLLITSSLPKLPAAVTSVVLTLQPVGSMLLGAFLLGERPTPVQVAGVGLVVLALLHATGATARRRVVPSEPLVATS